ncbi:MAG: amylo-alpha-1,6-glucosidase [Vulcanimicrobiaceae bacterium]
MAFAERRLRTLKHETTFAVFDTRGDLGTAPDTPEGLYRADTRLVSRYELSLDGFPPMFLSVTSDEGDPYFRVDLTNPDITRRDGSLLGREALYLTRVLYVWHGALYERIAVRNFDGEAHDFSLALRFAADFVDMFEVRGQHRPRRGTLRVETGPTIVARYQGLDGVERKSEFSFAPEPAELSADRARFVFRLAPHQSAAIFARAGAPARAAEGPLPRAFFENLRAARRAAKALRSRATQLESDDAGFNRWTRGALADLSTLIVHTDRGPYPDAGLPWYATQFGRDGLVTALFTLWLDPQLARGVLAFLAATQASEVDPERDAEPGKIVHEMRHGEMARLGEVPFGRYYGSVDATPLFVLLYGSYVQRTGDLETARALWPNVEAALGWIDRYGDCDGDGFVEYGRHSPDGLINQGWKDSSDAIFHADGTTPKGPIALCEVQSYVYGAKRLAAEVADALGESARASALREQAEELRERFERAFWCEELSCYALALDGEKRPCRVVTSNAGHALLSGIASPERARRVIETLLHANSYSGWGIRTLSRAAIRFNPMSYHNGSVWPHDNALIALGCARYGLKEAAATLFASLYHAASFMDQHRLPELFCGFARRSGNAPTLYPVACVPQAWASASAFALVQAALGLSFDPGERRLRFVRPLLPAVLAELHLGGLSAGEATADVIVRRFGSEVAVNVTRRSGGMRVVVVH